MVYTTKPFNHNERNLWDCNYLGALESIEMARVVSVLSRDS